MTTLTHRIEHDPDLVFAAITDLARSPDWNRAISRVLDVPDSLLPGSEWVVEVGAFGRRWPSRSRVEIHDPETRTFRYRSGTDDGNPSHTEWQWTVAPVPGGSEVTVAWQVVPCMYWRRVLLSRIRQRQLSRTEVPASLDALPHHVSQRPTPDSPTTGRGYPTPSASPPPRRDRRARRQPTKRKEPTIARSSTAPPQPNRNHPTTGVSHRGRPPAIDPEGL